MPYKRSTPRKRKNSGILLKGRVDESLAALTLAEQALVGANFDEALDEEAFLLSMEALWSTEGFTVGEGPIFVGIAHSDYTDAEIEEVIENTGSWSRGNKIAQEMAKRLIRTVGVFPLISSEETLNDGVKIKTTIKWPATTGQTLKMWAYNRGTNPLTTGGQVHAQGHVWIRPK